MNLLSRELKLNQIWGNSSGLPVNPNFSSPLSIGILSSLAIKNPIFNKIVSTKIHEIEIKNERYGLIRRITWRNTNKLLEEGWDGVKTGTTDTAGHCLAAKRNNLLFCVFNCDSLSKRFSECVKLY
jgi:D-alanyl-D-alanine carboxypeptidase